MAEIRYRPIGVIHSPFRKTKGMPIQTTAAEGAEGIVDVFPEYSKGLKDIQGFSHVILIYHFHLSKKPSLVVKPYLDAKKRGVFATRAPSRPNPIGISVVRLTAVRGNTLLVRDIDIADGTPLLDLKPYVPDFDVKKVTRIGWLGKNVSRVTVVKDDGRFSDWGHNAGYEYLRAR